MKSSNSPFSCLTKKPYPPQHVCTEVRKLYVTFSGICCWKTECWNYSDKCEDQNDIIPTESHKVHTGTSWHQPKKCDTILSLPLQTFCGFRVRMRRREKNKYVMKCKPHQEQKIRAERPQSSIFMGKFEFYPDRVRK